MAQQIRALMPPNPEAARAIRDADMGDVIVIEHHRVCGMVTDRDLVVRTLAEGRDPATTTLADICRHPFLVVSPTDSVEKAVRRMGTQALRRVPVVEGGSRWAWCRWGIWRRSGIRARRSAPSALHPA